MNAYKTYTDFVEVEDGFSFREFEIDFRAEANKIQALADKFGVPVKDAYIENDGEFVADLENDEYFVAIRIENGFFHIDDTCGGNTLDSYGDPLTLNEFTQALYRFFGKESDFSRSQVATMANELRRRGVPASTAWKLAHAARKASSSNFASAWMETEVVIEFVKANGDQTARRAKLSTLGRRGPTVVFESITNGNALRSFIPERLVSIEVGSGFPLTFKKAA